MAAGILKATVLTKEKFDFSLLCSGIIYRGEEDSAKAFRIYAGPVITAKRRALCHEAPRSVKEKLIDELNIPFSTDDQGLDLTEGGHHVRRIIHYQDQTAKIQNAFRRR